MDKFKKLGIIEPVLLSIKEQGFDKPTQIQSKSILPLLEGKDVIATSVTGSGKTLAFASRVIEVCEVGRGVQGIIIVPTRELAKQVTNEMIKYSKHCNIEVVAIYGGLSINKQTEALKSANIVVSTTGRLLEHISQGNIDFKNMKTIVLDEADLMIGAEFIEDVENIFEVCPDYIQKLMFSATINEEVLKFASKYMNNPQKILAKFVLESSKLKQICYNVQDDMKLSLLVHCLKYKKAGLSLVFANRQENAKLIALNVKKYTDLKVGVVHGGLSTGKRNRVIKDFKDQRFDVLVATDIAARGIDVNYITHVYNYNIPKDKTKYVHRVGRTARAGKEGEVVNFVSNKDYDLFTSLVDDMKTVIFKNIGEVEIIKPQRKEIKSSKKIIKKGNKKYYR